MNPNLPSQISMLMLGVSDVPRSIAFYRDTLGFELRHSAEEFAFFAAGSVTLVLSRALGRAVEPLPGATEIILPVASATASQALLAERGCAFINQPREVTPGSWAATFTDPDGHRLTVFGPR
jgi:predicted enzyme related to lactoylglutathione lyase